MKKIIIILIFLFVVSALLNIFIAENVKADANTIYVDNDGGQDYISIQDAIDAANSGDTIYVNSGEYAENIIINKTLNLIGNPENVDDVIIDGSDNGDVVTITADFVNITGFTIKNSGDKDYFTSGISSVYYYENVIKVNKLNNIIISHNKIINNEYGIYIDVNNSKIENNYISNNSAGLWLEGCSHNTIHNNVFINNDAKGLSLEGSSYNLIKSNSFKNNGETFVLIDSHYSTSNNNTIYYNNFHEYEHVIDCSSDNNLYYNKQTSKGNYWVEYFYYGVEGHLLDHDFDGVGDTPFDIECGGEVTAQDLYPLMEPTEELDSDEKEEKDVDTYVYLSWLQENGNWNDWIGFSKENQSFLLPLHLKIGQPLKAKIIIIPHLACNIYFTLYEPFTNDNYAFEVLEGASHLETLFVKEDGSITTDSSAQDDIIPAETNIEYIWELSPKDTWINDYENAQLLVSYNVDFASSDLGMHSNLVIVYPNIKNQKWQESTENEDGIPGFELVTIIFAITILLLSRKKRK